MRYGNNRVWGIITIFLLSGFLWFGCKKSTNPPPVDTEIADSLVALANDSLAVLMDQVVNETFENADSSFRPNDVDFTELYDLYKSAYSENASNNDARFGIAFCGLMSFLADPTLNNVYENTKYDFDTTNFDFIELDKITPNFNIGTGLIPSGIPNNATGLGNFLPNILGISMGTAFKSSATADIEDFQVVIENKLMPLLLEARTHLTALSGKASYTFTITPAMQGNLGASAVLIDQSDFQIFLAVINAFEALMHVVMSRDFDIGYQSAEALETSLNKGSNFLKLRTGSHMAQAKTRLLAASSAVKTAIDRLLAEIGTNQSNDLIPVDAGDRADLNEVKADILEFESYFTGTTEIEIIWETDCYHLMYEGYEIWECDEDTLLADIDVSKIFDNPIADLKELLPDYTITIVDGIGELQDETSVCFEWQASSLETWTFPNPTFNGLFPNWTSSSVKDLIYDVGDEWEKTICDTL